MLYHLHQIYSKIANIPSLASHKTEIIHFFQNIYSETHIHTIYTHDQYPSYFLNETDFKNTLFILNQKFNTQCSIDDFYQGNRPLKKLEDPKQIQTAIPHSISSDQELAHILQIHQTHSTYGKNQTAAIEKKQCAKEEKKQKLSLKNALKHEQQKKEFDKISNLHRDFINSSILSIDFEFFHSHNSSYQPTEIGIVMYHHGEYKNYHFLIEENYQKKQNKSLQYKFDFGKTHIISQKEIKPFLTTLIQHTQYLLFHEKREDMLIFEQLGIFIPKNICIVDTQMAYKRYFRKKGSLPNGESLDNLLKMFQIPYQHLHNAGNDAYFTLSLLHAMSSSIMCRNTQQNKKETKKLKTI